MSSKVNLTANRIQSSSTLLSSRTINLFIAVFSSFVTIAIYRKVSDRSASWAIGFVLVLVFISLFVLVKKKKYFLYSSLFIGLSIQTNIFLWKPTPLFYPHGTGPDTAPQLFAFDLPLVLLFFYVISHKNKFEYDNFRNSDLAAGFLILFSLLSFVNSRYPILSFTGLLVMIRMPIIYYCLSRSIKNENDLKHIFNVVIFCVFVQSILGILQTIFGSIDWLYILSQRIEQVKVTDYGVLTINRASGTIGWTTEFAQYLGLLSPMALAYFLYNKRKSTSLISGLVYIFALIALIASLSRIEWVNIIGVLFLMLIFGLYKKQLKTYSFRVRTLIIFLVVVIISVIFAKQIILRATSRDFGSAFARIPMSKVAFQMIIHNPILGVGLNNYAERMYEYGLGRLLPGQTYGVHNAFLALCGEIGIAGLLSLLYLWILTYRKMIYIFRKARYPLWNYSAGLICGLTAFIIHANLEQSFHAHAQLNGIMWSLFGIVAGYKIIIDKQIKADN